MAPVRIVTDAAAHLSPEQIARHRISVLPLEIQFGEDRFVVGPEGPVRPLFERLVSGPADPVCISVSPRVVQETYRQLHRETDEILVILSSRLLSGAHQVAEAESRSFLGRCRITLSDSMSSSWGLGLVVMAAARAADQGRSTEQIIRLVRGMLPHIYLVLIVERLDYLRAWGRIGLGQAALGSMLKIKPLLTMEDGEILPVEKVRTQPMAIDKLTEFVAEFASVQQAVVLKSPLQADANELRAALQARLGPTQPHLRFPVVDYDPLLACHVGPEAFGVMVYEA
jgi:DegV family protein with EDD domain